MVDLILWVFFLLAGFLIGRNYERKHPTTAEEAQANRAIGALFKRKKD